MKKGLDASIERFAKDGWDKRYPSDQWYIMVDVVYPEQCVAQCIFDEQGYKNFVESITKPDSEVVRIVYRYQRRGI